jgi:hypothetical protein
LLHYSLIEKILTLEYFLHKFGSNCLDSLLLEESVFKGLPFWNIDYNDELSQAQIVDKNEKLAE